MQPPFTCSLRVLFVQEKFTNVHQQLTQDLQSSGKFSIQLDETTTVTEEALLLIFVRYIKDDELRNDLLESVNLTTTTKGGNIFSAVDEIFQKHQLDYENLIACCTDGAACMMGVNQGFNTRLKAVAPQCRIIHCFIHRQALAAKKLSKNLNNMLFTYVKLLICSSQGLLT